MARPRTPLAKAKITGQTYSNSTRFKGRKEPTNLKQIGKAPSSMNATQRKAWDTFVAELPWLNHSHRALLEIASSVRARLSAGEDCSVAELTLLRQCLSSMGATPADASKINFEEEDEEDPADKYFRKARSK